MFCRCGPSNGRVKYAFEMRVRVLYFGVLKDGFGREGEWLELAEGASVADVVVVCRGRFGGAPWESIAVAVNLEYARASDLLKEGDEVALLPPVSGGSCECLRSHPCAMRPRMDGAPDL